MSSKRMQTQEPLLIVIFGPPGVGKGTLARKLLTQLEATFIDRDLIIAPFLKGAVTDGNPLYAELVGPGSYAAMLALAQDNLALGGTVVIESPFRDIMLGKRHEIIDTIVAEIRAQLFWVLCWADEETVKERIRTRGDSRDANKLESWDEHAKKWHRFTPHVHLDYKHLILDTAQSVVENVWRILEVVATN